MDAVVRGSDGAELDNPVQVETIQYNVLQALCYLFARRRRDTPLHLMIGRTVAALTELRSASAAVDSLTVNASLCTIDFSMWKRRVDNSKKVDPPYFYLMWKKYKSTQ